MSMWGWNWRRSVVVLLAVIAVWAAVGRRPGHGQVPEFVAKSQSPALAGEQTAVLAGGCFWGVDAVFKHVKGVKKVVSGYAGGREDTAAYDLVSTGSTGHAESVEITYDPSQVSYSDLIRVFFSVAHDPTELNRRDRMAELNIVPRSSMPMTRKNRSRWLTSIN